MPQFFRRLQRPQPLSSKVNFTPVAFTRLGAILPHGGIDHLNLRVSGCLSMCWLEQGTGGVGTEIAHLQCVRGLEARRQAWLAVFGLGDV